MEAFQWGAMWPSLLHKNGCKVTGLEGRGCWQGPDRCQERWGEVQSFGKDTEYQPDPVPKERSWAPVSSFIAQEEAG